MTPQLWGYKVPCMIQRFACYKMQMAAVAQARMVLASCCTPMHGLEPVAAGLLLQTLTQAAARSCLACAKPLPASCSEHA